MCARSELTTETLVTYGDLLYEERLVREAVESPHDVAVVVDRDWRSYWEFRYGSTEEDLESLSLSADGRIGDIGRSLDSSEGLQYRYVGLVKFSLAGLRAAMRLYDRKSELSERWVQSRQPFPGGCMTDLLHELAAGGAEVRPVEVEGGWLEFDTPEDYERALELDRRGGLIRFIDLGKRAAKDGGKARGE